MVLIALTETSISKKRPMSFRPLAGIMVLIDGYVLNNDEAGQNSFRPLAGIMVLIEYAIWILLELQGIVSVPLRGLWFLSSYYWE